MVSPLPTLSEAETAGSAIATNLGCSTAACLRAVPVAEILGQEGAGAVSIVDGQVLKQQLASAFETGAFNKVPVMDGSNHDEWRLFVALDFDLAGRPITAADYPFVIGATFGAALAPSVIAHYPLSSYPSPDVAFAAAVTDPTFSCTARLADQLLARFVPTFAYEFNDENAPELFLPPVSFPYGAAHASELQYLFKLRAAFPQALDAAQQMLSQTMIGYWTNFASSGDPNSSGAPEWRQYGVSDQFQSLVPSTPTTETNFAVDHQCSFWMIP